jgi:hypothetical protein
MNFEQILFKKIDFLTFFEGHGNNPRTESGEKGEEDGEGRDEDNQVRHSVLNVLDDLSVFDQPFECYVLLLFLIFYFLLRFLIYL